jgi:ComF family protein
MLSPWTRLTQGLPGTCQVCERWPAQPVCPACEQRFAVQRPRCHTCAGLLLGAGPCCGACLTRPGPLRQCVAAVDYAYPWDGLLARFKFQGESAWAQVLARLMLDAPGALPLLAGADWIVPVPLSAQRLGQRGYNQAWELVKALRRQARARGQPVAAGLAEALVRTRHTPDQHGLARQQRLTNLHGAFASHPAQTARLAGAQVLLVDDVSTTGATLHSAAQSLLQAGARQVGALVFARTPAS